MCRTDREETLIVARDVLFNEHVSPILLPERAVRGRLALSTSLMVALMKEDKQGPLGVCKMLFGRVGVTVWERVWSTKEWRGCMYCMKWITDDRLLLGSGGY